MLISTKNRGKTDKTAVAPATGGGYLSFFWCTPSKRLKSGLFSIFLHLIYTRVRVCTVVYILHYFHLLITLLITYLYFFCFFLVGIKKSCTFALSNQLKHIKMKNRFLSPLIIIVVLFIISAIVANAVMFLISIICGPVIGLLFWYEEKNEVRKY